MGGFADKLFVLLLAISATALIGFSGAPADDEEGPKTARERWRRLVDRLDPLRRRGGR